MKKTAPVCSTAPPCWTPTAASWVFTARPTFRTDHYYQEKFYFTPGNTGFKVFDTQYGRVGVGICWDQWFPETARCLALAGADLILYPTAIGSEPILDVDSAGHWQRTMQGHAAANVLPVVAANRYGTEVVTPCRENGGQQSALRFYGTSFLTDETGAVLVQAGRDEDAVLTASYDFAAIRQAVWNGACSATAGPSAMARSAT